MFKKIEKALLIKTTERRQVIYFLSLFLIIGAGMSLGRGTTDALFYKRYGIEYLPVMYIILSVLMMIISTVYAAFSDMIPAERFFKILFCFLIVLLTGNWALISFTDIQIAYPMYFLLYEIASELLIVHATLYMSQNFETLQAKRLTPLIFGGLQIGTIMGGLFLTTTAQKIGVHNILLVWGALLFLAFILITLHHRQSGTSPHFRAPRKSRDRMRQIVGQVGQGLKFVKHSALLRSLSIGLFFMVIAFYVLCYSLGRIYTETFKSEEELTAFFGMLTVVCGSLGLLMQIFVTNRVLRRFGVKNINMIFPVTTLAVYGGLLFSFTFPVALLGSFNKDALMPAFRNPVRNLFFNALPNYMQGRARAMSIALVLPLALLAAGGLLIIAQKLDNSQFFLAIGLLATIFYAWYSLRMNREYLAGIVSVLREKVFLPKHTQINAINTNDAQVLAELVRGVEHEDDDICRAYTETLIQCSPDYARAIILAKLEHASDTVVDKLLPHLDSIQPDGYRDFLLRRIDNGDGHVKTSAIYSLINFDAENTRLNNLVAEFLRSSNPRLKAAAIYGVLKLNLASLITDAQQCQDDLLSSDDNNSIIAGLCLLEKIPHGIYRQRLIELLGSTNARVLLAALNTIYNWPDTDLPLLAQNLERLSEHDNPEVRLMCTRCSQLLYSDDRIQISNMALEDDHPTVRQAAIESRFYGHDNVIEQIIQWTTENTLPPRSQTSLLDYLIDHQPGNKVLRNIALIKSQDAKVLAQIKKSLIRFLGDDTHSPGTELLIYILTERQLEVLDMALMVMEHFEDPVTIGVIRAGISSGDERHIANAAEALRHIDDKQLADMLGSLIEDMDEIEYDTEHQFPTLRAILEWCGSRSDPWMNMTAKHAIASL